MKEEIIPIYSGKPEDFHWVGFGSGKGTNLRECAKIIKPVLIFSDRPKAELFNLEELIGIHHKSLDGYKICGSWNKAKGNPELEAEYEKKSYWYNQFILDALMYFKEERRINIDLIVLGGYMRLVKEPLLNAFKDKIINVHPADLSKLNENNSRKYVGEDAVYDAIKSKEKTTCSSIIIVDKKTDHGEIITQGPNVMVWPEMLKKNIDENILRGYTNVHKEYQKKVSDWPALTTVLKMISEGRISLGTKKVFFDEWRRVYIDGKAMGYGGYQLSKIMIDEKFKKIIEPKIGFAIIIAGSSSDKPHIEKVVESLEKYEIPYRVRICSAHRQPEKLISMIKEYNKIKGLVAYVTIAGGTDDLSGILSYNALSPVISCPPNAPNYSCLKNPAGSSNAYIEKPENVGKFIAQMYAEVNPKYKELLQKNNAKNIESLEKADLDFQKKYGGV